MKRNNAQTTKVIITLVCIVVAVVSLITIVFSVEVLSNKNGRTSYEEIGDTEQKMIETLNAYLVEKKITLDVPVAFVKNNGFMRGRAYVFNVKLTENRIGLNNAGTYSTEILLPDEYDMPTMYRCSSFAPDFGSMLFPSDYGTQRLFGEDVTVVAFNEKTLQNGAFITLLDKLFNK